MSFRPIEHDDKERRRKREKERVYAYHTDAHNTDIRQLTADKRYITGLPKLLIGIFHHVPSLYLLHSTYLLPCLTPLLYKYLPLRQSFSFFSYIKISSSPTSSLFPIYIAIYIFPTSSSSSYMLLPPLRIFVLPPSTFIFFTNGFCSSLFSSQQTLSSLPISYVLIINHLSSHPF